ncbi:MULTISPECIES: leucyl aminopeptidase family protein [Brucella]|uniref:Cytosol aminopeptidase family, N-terminal domain protein n=1 Tax=Brucella lupini TaxID=255457 RepID=A0A256GS42_9HYPH|nr:MULTISPECIES: leucyl aminopeptidase family protein [Brucella]KAB2705643.1 leucyl aminopeptidase family protein [Brucella lupini]KAB2726790.1 leucyl aminopeptidase family protein [Brucella anthropi]KAB2743952.1 leucyl aminopeptidase family protein [Brucella anthropi]KAB2797009.1 leucyl aminopeptidase family protein [Brucella anthropi]KAB2804699.1 leucyl aminopeptidase family protein [Brucella anthropi]
MSVELLSQKSEQSRPIWFTSKGGLETAGLPADAIAWAGANGFDGEAGRVLVLPGAGGSVSGALFGTGSEEKGSQSQLLAGKLARSLPEGDWHIEGAVDEAALAVLGFLMGAYSFTRYRKANDGKAIRLALPDGVDEAEIRRIAAAVILVRDLINTPTNDMGPDALENAARELASKYKADIAVTEGDALLEKNFPMIHAVGRAGAIAPRLIDLSWGKASDPKITLVGKGVCFDTGGLDIKPASGMLLMKKDMGGAANVLGLASMIMDAQLPVRLRVLIPAVENSIAGNAFRPGDVLQSRKGLTVEIGNTDAEGRLVLADALALADEEEPALLIDMATLTGAARVALGPDLPPFYTYDDGLASSIAQSADDTADPLWRMPLWKPYAQKLSSRIADINNVTTDGFAGSVTAALFLSKFVEKAQAWAHFDIFGWVPVEKPASPVGGEAQAIRALYQLLKERYPAR